MKAVFDAWYMDELCTEKFDYITYVKGGDDLILFAGWAVK